MPTKKSSKHGPAKLEAAQNGATEPSAPEQKLRPDLEPMLTEHGVPPEQGIGARIRFARNQLGLSIEALSRYSANFDYPDKRGISATTLLRYENGDPLPGARELRILAEAFDVPPQWLLLGRLDNAGRDEIEQNLIAALENYVRGRAIGADSAESVFSNDDSPSRWKWLKEAKNPGG